MIDLKVWGGEISLQNIKKDFIPIDIWDESDHIICLNLTRTEAEIIIIHLQNQLK